MERISESLLRTTFSMHSEDPYASAHEILHRAERWGRVSERANRVLTTGPETTAEVRFSVDKKLDKFARLHISFDIGGKSSVKTIYVTIEASLECELPTPHGMASTMFNEFYRTRFLAAHMKLAQDTAVHAAGEVKESLGLRSAKVKLSG